ncbi:hypothetical protein DRE_02922 [Drechslerella stenobrocha 248]|uniref:G-protein coupled receptors family 1 profile domain-containing protein n=1 Tax=Drechslerella stenobrocha 248 TaxID=1043628 RepID=W7I5H5_9PEZI|nr:hypothetical protein DRE_02922 [Drechslerella stenobrocha 248]
MFTTIAMTMAVLNLIGSLSSFLGSGFIAITYLILPIKRHFRHSLILNLAIADFINSTNNSTSGLWRLITKKEIPSSPACIANGFIGQLSVQATDTSILAIAIVTVWSLTRKTMIRETLSPTTTILICGATWVLPVTTTFIILGMDRYGPVSGNWCWIKAEPSYFRYAMTHGWRFAFILSEVIMYTYLYFYIRRRFGTILDASHSVSNTGKSTVRDDVGGLDAAGHNAHRRNLSQALANADDDGEIHPAKGLQSDDIESGVYVRTQVWVSEAPCGKTDAATGNTTTVTLVPGPLETPRPTSSDTTETRHPRFQNPFAHRRHGDDLAEDPKEATDAHIKQSNAARSRRVRRILLLNAYPAMYILLWIPGIVNRLIEASGGKSPVTQVLQASTQFVGLANAITYGWNERVGRQLADYIAERWGSTSSRKRSAQEAENSKIELQSRMKVRLQGSKERLREIRNGLKDGLRPTPGADQLAEDQGDLIYVNGKWEWTRSMSFNGSQAGDEDGQEDGHGQEQKTKE